MEQATDGSRARDTARDTVRMVVSAVPLITLSAMWLPWLEVRSLYGDGDGATVSGWRIIEIMFSEGGADVLDIEGGDLTRLVAALVLVVLVLVPGLTWVHFSVPRTWTAVALSLAIVLGIWATVAIGVWEPRDQDLQVEVLHGLSIWRVMLVVILAGLVVRGALEETAYRPPFDARA